MLAPFYRLNENETKKSYGTVGSNFESSYLIIAKKFVCTERIELLFVTRISLDSHLFPWYLSCVYTQDGGLSNGKEKLISKCLERYLFQKKNNKKMFKKRTSEWTRDSLFSIFSLNHVAVSNKNRRKSSGEAWWTRACWKPQKEKKKMLANKMQAGRCILIRYPYLQPRDVYAEICTRRKAYETRGISCCAPFVLCREWFPCESPIPPPCAPRPGYRALFIRYERYEILVYTEYSKHGNARRSCNYGSLFFFFRDSRTTHTHTQIYIYPKRNVLQYSVTIHIGPSRNGTRMENFTFHRGRPKKGNERVRWKRRIENRARWRRISSNPPCTNYTS